LESGFFQNIFRDIEDLRSFHHVPSDMQTFLGVAYKHMYSINESNQLGARLESEPN